MMEEVDAIIIETLKCINCNLEDVTSLKKFTTEMIVVSIVVCLKAINPEITLSQTLPHSMSLRLKLATDMVNHIKNLGYKGDIGYQSILYASEIEIRRILMYLIERLPRETSKTNYSEDAGFAAKLLKKVQIKLQKQLNQIWVPSSFAKVKGYDSYCREIVLSHPLQTVNIRTSFLKNSNEASRYYNIHHLPSITLQCSSKTLLPSLLFKDFVCSNKKALINPESEIKEILTSKLNVNEEVITTLEVKNDENADVISKIENNKVELKNLQQEQMQLTRKLDQVTDDKNKTELLVKESLDKIQLQKKTLSVLSKEENFEKLNNLIDQSKQRLTNLAAQWEQIQAPLLTEYETVTAKKNVEEEQSAMRQKKIDLFKDKYKNLVHELMEKEKQEHNLTEEYKKLNTNMNRVTYTRRINEIIYNIRKQNEEIEKILNATKDVQKDINNLNGQLDRSFVLCDELIFRDAKSSEMSRRAYKFLATLHAECGAVVQTVTDLGMAARECKTLEEQLEADNLKEVLSKLEQVQKDLAEVLKEVASLQNH